MTGSRRDEYVEQLKARLDEWNAQLDQLETESEQAHAQLSAQFREQLAEARSRRDEAQQRLVELQKAGESAWDDMVAGAEQAWQSFADAFKKARSRFDD